MKPETKQEIQEILEQVASCEIPTNWRVNSNLPGAGIRRSFYRGAGYEFESLDEYVPGDDPRDIDWNATAETGGEMILKNVYREPRDLKVFLLVDVDPSMDFGTTRATKRRLAAELVASICQAADETQDRVGFIAYSAARVEKRLASRAARVALLPILANLLEAKATTGAGSGLAKALSSLPADRCLVFLVSGFLHLSDEDRSAIKKAGLKHDVLCLLIQDERERQLPSGWGFYTLQDLSSGQRKTIFVSRKTREAFAANFQNYQAALISFLKQVHCRWETFSTEEGRSARPKILRLFASHR